MPSSSLQPSFRYEQISPKSYEHPADRAATAALRSIPLMDKVLKRLSDISHERRLRQVLIGNAVRVSDKQIPQLWARYCQAASVLDIDQIPELYVTQTPLANALTLGAKRPMVIIFSGLASDYKPGEVDVVLAHELGHVLSEHYYYQTALVVLALMVGSRTVSLRGLPVMAVYLVLLEWSRAAELSADRASALVAGDPLATCQVLMRMAGGAVDGMSLDAFLAQAAEYAEEEDLFARWSRAWVETRLSHPFAVKRARELMEWVRDGSYDRVRSGAYVRRGQEPPATTEMAAAVAHYRERFLRILGVASGGVEKMLRQLEDWLRPGPSGPPVTAGDDGEISSALPTRRIGSLKVSLVGLGCNNFGGRTDERTSAEVVAAALGAGVTLFDTADIYAGTRSEGILGRALGRRRSEVVVATKFGMAIDDQRTGAKPAYVKSTLKDSLRRLGTDHVDLYQLHRPDPTTPIGDTLAALGDLVREGKVREIGCSNFSAVQLREADAAAARGRLASSACRTSTASCTASPRLTSWRSASASGLRSCPTTRSCRACSLASTAGASLPRPARAWPGCPLSAVGSCWQRRSSTASRPWSASPPSRATASSSLPSPGWWRGPRSLR